MLSQTTEYALRAAVCLGREGGMVATGTLANHCRVPMNYLAKVLQKLAASDLVAGRRGVGGGYRLSRDPAEIRLIDVVNAVEPLRRMADNGDASDAELHRLGLVLDTAANRSVAVLADVTIAQILDGRDLDHLNGR